MPPAIASARDCTMITASGLQLAMGSGQASRDCAEVLSTAAGMPIPEDERADNDNHPFNDPNIAVIAGAVLILLSLIASFLLKGAMAGMAAAGGSLLAACALVYAVIIQAPAEVRNQILSSGGGMGGQNMPGLGGGAPTATQIDKMIHTSPAIGFWLVLVALLAAIALNVMASRKPGAEAPPAAV
ncbi:MAG TPA: hypothetical protein VGO55_10200 [Allosphingosinicella sp.]|nr:hypothetical protein [Allosphingosinicella sp.]